MHDHPNLNEACQDDRLTGQRRLSLHPRRPCICIPGCMLSPLGLKLQQMQNSTWLPDDRLLSYCGRGPCARGRCFRFGAARSMDELQMACWMSGAHERQQPWPGTLIEPNVIYANSRKPGRWHAGGLAGAAHFEVRWDLERGSRELPV